MEIYLRPLHIEDALISYKWRNNPKIWELTGTRPDKAISPKMETVWLTRVLKHMNERRYAICLKATNEYIGNVQLTDITQENAQFHIFIGNTKYWGMGIASEATKQMIAIGFNEIGLKSIYLMVNKNNTAAIKVYLKNNFKQTSEQDDQILMTCFK